MSYMKRKFLLAAAGIAFLVSCGSDDKAAKAKENEPTTISAPDKSENPDYKNGLAIVGKSGCTSCHAVNDKISGPPYSEVAEKYAGSDTALTYLTQKILKGGTGVWGEVPMPPNPISEADAEACAKYILLLKK